MKMDFDLVVLNAVCIEQPSADGKSVYKRTEKILGNIQSIGAVYASLSFLEDKGLVWHEIKNGDKKLYFYPTEAGMNKNKEDLNCNSYEYIGNMCQCT